MFVEENKKKLADIDGHIMKNKKRKRREPAQPCQNILDSRINMTRLAPQLRELHISQPA